MVKVKTCSFEVLKKCWEQQIKCKMPEEVGIEMNIEDATKLFSELLKCGLNNEATFLNEECGDTEKKETVEYKNSGATNEIAEEPKMSMNSTVDDAAREEVQNAKEKRAEEAKKVEKQVKTKPRHNNAEEIRNNVLEYIKNKNCAVTQKEIAISMQYSQPAISKTLASLRKESKIVRVSRGLYAIAGRHNVEPTEKHQRDETVGSQNAEEVVGQQLAAEVTDEAGQQEETERREEASFVKQIKYWLDKEQYRPILRFILNSKEFQVKKLRDKYEPFESQITEIIKFLVSEALITEQEGNIGMYRVQGFVRLWNFLYQLGIQAPKRKIMIESGLTEDELESAIKQCLSKNLITEEPVGNIMCYKTVKLD